MTFSTLASPGVSLQGGGGSGGGAASLPISGNGATVTASTPLVDGTQTWNNAAVTFTSFKLNITDTASNAASLLMDLQVGGTSRFSVTKGGGITIPLGTSAGYGFAGGTVSLYAASNALNIYSGALVTLVNAASSFGWIDTFLTRRAAANLRLGSTDAAAPVAQTLSVQSVVAGTTNIAGANLTITGSQGTGTGAGGSIIFQVAPAGSSGSAQNALSTALTIGSDRSLTSTSNITMGTTSQLSAAGGAALSSPADSVWRMMNNAGTDFNRLQFGGGTASFPALKRSSTTLQARLADDSAFASVQGKLTTETAYTAGSIVPTGYLTLYDSTGTAYRVPCVV